MSGSWSAPVSVSAVLPVLTRPLPPLSYQAALRALDAAGLTAADLDMIVLATTSAENAFPAAACELQGLLGVPGIPAFDVAAACAQVSPTRSPSPISFVKSGAGPPCAGRRG